MPRHCVLLSIAAACCFTGGLTAQLAAQITDISPRVCKPGATTRLTVTGKGLDQGLRAWTNRSDAKIEIESAEPQQATIHVALSTEVAFGPLGIWLATDAGPHPPLILLVDDLPWVADLGNHQSPATAQELPTLAAVHGQLEAAKSDYFRIQVNEGERVAIEVRTQAIESTIDPVVRILSIDGEPIRRIDDDNIGPDVRFSHQFTVAGEYLIHIQESSHRAGSYYLRVGDFPVLYPPSPLVVQRGKPTTVAAESTDGQPAVNAPVTADRELAAETTMIGVKFPQGNSSAWVRLGLSNVAQLVESEADDQPIQLPVAMTGRLDQPGESDKYLVQGTKDTRVTFHSRTRSLGSESLVGMQLLDSSGKSVGKTEVSDSDEWSFEYTFPDDGIYTLQVTELLHRGGPGFRYAIEIAPTTLFQVSLKPDASTRTEFAIEPQSGACPIDLQIDRNGYDGSIQIELADRDTGLKILDPTIPAKAKTARILIVPDDDWTPSSAGVVSLVAKQTGNDQQAFPVKGLGLYRVKSPSVPFPISWRNGDISLGGVATSEPYFSLQPTADITLARPVKTHIANLALQRTNAEFKADVTLLGHSLPDGWSVAAKANKDSYTATLTRADLAVGQPEKLALDVFAEFNGRGRMETVEFPVSWFDPIGVTIAAAKPIAVESPTTLVVAVQRQGDDPQPATLKWKNVPAGVTLNEVVALPADQSTVTVDITVSAQAEIGPEFSLAYDLTSKYQEQEFAIEGKTPELTVIGSPERIVTYPSEVTLPGPKHRQQLVVTGFDDLGAPRDWSRDVQWTSADPEIAEIRNGVVYPKQNGQTDVVANVGTLSQSISVHVTGFDEESPIEFESEVLVALSKQGCNSGACHGSPSGKGMFRLSLRAFDKKLDELTLIREDFGRRVNRIEPDKSLLLMKPTMSVSHGGGKQLHKEDPAYSILLDWIAGGAKADSAETNRPTGLTVFPNEKQILHRNQGGQQLAVTAHFADGSSRDVTHLVAYETSDTSVATIDANGWVTPGGRGEAMVIVRYLEFIESVPVTFVDHIPDFQWTSPPEANYIDELANAKLKQLQYLPSETCSDSEFLRRVYLDVIGILPSLAEVEAFLADVNENKRAEVIDTLLERDEFAKYWALKWGDLLKMTNKLVGQEGVYKYHRWVEDAFADNMPYDQFARQLITASGSTLANPPANFYRTAEDTNERVETVSQVFLGARLQCAKCHNHPFERWTQDNYYGLSAFFNRVRKRNTQRPGEMFVWSDAVGEVTQPRTGETMAPWVPGQSDVEPGDDSDRRQAFANWLVNPTNPYFARIEANRLWSQLFARGIVDPIDDFRDSNPPSNGPLLDALANDLVNSGFDRKHLLRQILNSRTYQASFQTNSLNEQDTVYFSHQHPRLLGAEQLLDAVNHLLDLPQTLGGLPAGTMATQMPAPDIAKIDFLKVFGQPERSTVCACERTDNSNLGMAIELFNGNTIHGKLRDENNRFRKAIAAGVPTQQIIVELYLAAFCRQPTDKELKTALEHCATRGGGDVGLAAFCRQPTDKELKTALEHCATRGDVAAGLEDVCWALLNTDEFLFQH